MRKIGDVARDGSVQGGSCGRRDENVVFKVVTRQGIGVDERLPVNRQDGEGGKSLPHGGPGSRGADSLPGHVENGCQRMRGNSTCYLPQRSCVQDGIGFLMPGRAFQDPIQDHIGVEQDAASAVLLHPFLFNNLLHFFVAGRMVCLADADELKQGLLALL